jgi:hypothetical protein
LVFVWVTPSGVAVVVFWVVVALPTASTAGVVTVVELAAPVASGALVTVVEVLPDTGSGAVVTVVDCAATDGSAGTVVVVVLVACASTAAGVRATAAAIIKVRIVSPFIPVEYGSSTRSVGYGRSGGLVDPLDSSRRGRFDRQNYHF